MITTEAWRASIGSHHNCRTSSLNIVIKGIIASNGSNGFGLSLGCTVLSAQLIAVLLIIGGVEANPGPFQRSATGKIAKNI